MAAAKYWDSRNNRQSNSFAALSFDSSTGLA
jgi:hypothetical protein